MQTCLRCHQLHGNIVNRNGETVPCPVCQPFRKEHVAPFVAPDWFRPMGASLLTELKDADGGQHVDDHGDEIR